MKKLVTVLLVGLMATAAFAGLDSGSDSFGVYFDANGNSNTSTQPVFTPFNVYLLLVNPTAATNGFECTLTPSGAPYFVLATNLGSGALDVDGSPNGYAVGAASAYAVNGGGAIVLATLQMMVQATTPLEFRIGPATVPSMPGGLPVVTGDGILRQCGISSGSTAAPVAFVNGTEQPVGQETSSFGSVKSLFR